MVSESPSGTAIGFLPGGQAELKTPRYALSVQWSAGERDFTIRLPPGCVMYNGGPVGFTDGFAEVDEGTWLKDLYTIADLDIDVDIEADGAAVTLWGFILPSQSAGVPQLRIKAGDEWESSAAEDEEVEEDEPGESEEEEEEEEEEGSQAVPLASFPIAKVKLVSLGASASSGVYGAVIEQYVIGSIVVGGGTAESKHPWTVEMFDTVESEAQVKKMNILRPYVRIGSSTVAASGTANVTVATGDWFCVIDCTAKTASLSQTAVNDGTHESVLVFRVSSGDVIEHCNVSPQVEIWEAPPSQS